MGGKRTEIIDDVRKFVKRHKDVVKAVLFGSAARGEMKENSDIDLILVSERFEGKSALKRPVQFYLDWDLGYPVDFLCYTSEEFDTLRKKATIVREALKEGIEISA